VVQTALRSSEGLTHAVHALLLFLIGAKTSRAHHYANLGNHHSNLAKHKLIQLAFVADKSFMNK